MTLSIQYNKLRKRIKIDPAANLKALRKRASYDDLAYHMLNGLTTSLFAVNVLLALSDDDFTLCVENAINMIDMSQEA